MQQFTMGQSGFENCLRRVQQTKHATTGMVKDWVMIQSAKFADHSATLHDKSQTLFSDRFLKRDTY